MKRGIFKSFVLFLVLSLLGIPKAEPVSTGVPIVDASTGLVIGIAVAGGYVVTHADEIKEFVSKNGSKFGDNVIRAGKELQQKISNMEKLDASMKSSHKLDISLGDFPSECEKDDNPLLSLVDKQLNESVKQHEKDKVKSVSRDGVFTGEKKGCFEVNQESTQSNSSNVSLNSNVSKSKSNDEVQYQESWTWVDPSKNQRVQADDRRDLLERVRFRSGTYGRGDGVSYRPPIWIYMSEEERKLYAKFLQEQEKLCKIKDSLKKDFRLSEKEISKLDLKDIPIKTFSQKELVDRSGKLEDFFTGAKLVSEKGKTKHFQNSGSFTQVVNTFKNLGLNNVKQVVIDGEKLWSGRLTDGQQVIIKSHKSDDGATVELVRVKDTFWGLGRSTRKKIIEYVPLTLPKSQKPAEIMLSTINLQEATVGVAPEKEFDEESKEIGKDEEKQESKEGEKQQGKSFDDRWSEVRSRAKPGRKTKGRVKQYEMPGDFDDVMRDFEGLGPSEIKDRSTGEKIVKVWELSDGRRVVARNGSSGDGFPTLELQDGKKEEKIRYGTKDQNLNKSQSLENQQNISKESNVIGEVSPVAGQIKNETKEGLKKTIDPACSKKRKKRDKDLGEKSLKQKRKKLNTSKKFGEKLPEVKPSELNPVDEKAKTHNLNENLQKLSQEREQNQKQGSFGQNSNVSQSFNINDFMEKNGLNEPGVAEFFLNELDKHIKKNPDLKKKNQDYIRKRSTTNSDNPMPENLRVHPRRVPYRPSSGGDPIGSIISGTITFLGNVDGVLNILFKNYQIGQSIETNSKEPTSYNITQDQRDTFIKEINYFISFVNDGGKITAVTSFATGRSSKVVSNRARAIKIIDTWLKILSGQVPCEKYIEKDAGLDKKLARNFVERLTLESARKVQAHHQERKKLMIKVKSTLENKDFSGAKNLLKEALNEHKLEGYHWKAWYAARRTVENPKAIEKRNYNTDSSRFKSFEGTPIQHFYHQILVNELNDAQKLKKEFVDAPAEPNKDRHTENITPLIRHHLEIAALNNKNKEFQKMLNNLKFAQELCELERRVIDLFWKKDTSFVRGVGHYVSSLFNWVTRQETKVNHYKEFGKRLNEFVKNASTSDKWEIEYKMYQAASALNEVIEDSYKDPESFKKAMLSDGQKHLDATKKRSYKNYQELIHFVESKQKKTKTNQWFDRIVSDEDDIWMQGNHEILHPVEFIYRKALEYSVDSAKKIDIKKKEKKKDEKQNQQVSKKKTTEEKKPQSKKRDEKQKSSNQTSTRITHLSTLSQTSDIERYGQDHILMCGYYAAHSARILAANHNQSPQTLRGLLNDRRSYEQQTLNPGRNLVRQMRGENHRDGISYLVGSEVEDILTGGRNRDLTGNIIVYGTGRIPSEIRSARLIQQFQNRQIDYLVYVVATRNVDSHWITVLLRRNQHNQVELVVTDSLGRDRSNEPNVQAIYNQFVGGNNQKAQKKSSSNLSSKNKEKKNEQASSSSFSQARVSPSCDNKQNIEIKSFINDECIEEFVIPEDDVEEYQEPKSKNTKKRKRKIKQFAQDKKMKLSERASRPRRKAFVNAKDSLKKMYASGRRKRKKKRDGLHARSHRRSSSRNQSKSTSQESVEQAGPEEPGGSDSSDDENKENLAKQFEKKISKMPPNERAAAVKVKAREVAMRRGLHRDATVSKINRRDVYRDKRTGDLYSVDTQHGRFEKLNKKGIHLGEVDFDFNATKKADLSGKHNLKL